MATWTSRTTIEASPDEILALLTDPEAVSHWSPLDFELERLDCERLGAGCRAQVGGELAGRRVSFDVEVIEASDGRLSLRASGPFVLDVEYRAELLDERSEMTAQVSVISSGGIRGRMISTAADAAVAGMLPMAVERIARAANDAALPLAA